MTHVVRRSVPVALMIALVLSAFGISGKAYAQGQNNTAAPGVWQSSINMQNTSTSSAADVQIIFYDGNGAQVATYPASGTTSIPAGGSLSIFVPNQVTTLPSGQFSAVVQSSQIVKATVNTSSTNSASAPWTAFGYEGVDDSSTGTSLYFPGNYKNYFGFFSEMVIQNADASAANLQVDFYRTNGSKINASPISLGTVNANASKTFPMNAIASLPSGNADGKFGAVVTATGGQKLAGVVNIWRTSPTNQTASYNAFTGGSATLYAPALYFNYFGFGSALTVQAVGGAAAGTITYSNGTTASFNLAANAAQEFYQPNDSRLPSGNQAGVFSARVQTTSGQVVGLVSLSQGTNPKGDFASYNVPGQASGTVNITNLLSDYFGYFSAVTVQNTSNTTAQNVTITYANGQSRNMGNVPANGTVNIIHLNSAGDILPDQQSLSAKVSSSNGAQLVAVVQHNTASGVRGYNPAKLPSDFLLALTGGPAN